VKGSLLQWQDFALVLLVETSKNVQEKLSDDLIFRRHILILRSNWTNTAKCLNLVSLEGGSMSMM